MDRQRHCDPVEWPPLHEGPNQPGPTDKAGEYRASQQVRAQPNVRWWDGRLSGARVPGEVRRTEQPIDVASRSKFPPPLPDLSAAERDIDDPRHIARGKGS